MPRDNGTSRGWHVQCVLFLCAPSPAMASLPCWLAFLAALPRFLDLAVMIGKVW